VYTWTRIKFVICQWFLANRKYNAIRFKSDLNNDGANWPMTNIKLAEVPLIQENKLMTECVPSTTGILSDANLKATMKATIHLKFLKKKQIAQVLQDNAEVKIKIIGHTDSDGDDATNLSLSKTKS